MKILGIDPGLHVTGYALVDSDSERIELCEAGVIKSKPSNSLERRLSDLYSGIIGIIEEFHPDVVSVEEIYSHYNHPKTAVIMGHARGVLFLAAGQARIPVYSYSATRIKKAITGRGHASKEQMARMIGMKLRWSEVNVVADVTDAIAAALCHIHIISHGGTL